MIRGAGILLLVLATPAALAQAPPNTRVSNCTTSGCHGRVVEAPFLHGPVAAGACEVCHAYSDERMHQFTLKREGAAMCAFCHLGKTDVGGLHVHAPVAAGQCLECHDPHGSTRRTMLRDDDGGEPCLRCHQSIIENRPIQHHPVATGDCTHCHKAHSSIFPNLLVQEGRDLCLSCHAQVLEPAGPPVGLPAAAPQPGAAPAAPGALAADHPPVDAAADMGPFMHSPVAGDCVACHDHHASKHEGLLVSEPVALCNSCHEHVADHIAKSPVAHAAVTDDKACMNCHTPHLSHAAHLLKSEPVRLCLECHAKEVTRADGTIVGAVAELADPALTRHPPMDQGSCRDCHDAHGADHPLLLTGAFPAGFYERFDVGAYGLCFKCHDSKLVEERITTTATRFRDGDLNLHAVHVNMEGVAGRSCRACHNQHASRHPRLTREWVAFGDWKLPIEFKATETGGSCAAGCHRARTYDRGAAAEPPAPMIPDGAP